MGVVVRLESAEFFGDEWHRFSMCSEFDCLSGISCCKRGSQHKPHSSLLCAPADSCAIYTPAFQHFSTPTFQHLSSSPFLLLFLVPLSRPSFSSLFLVPLAFAFSLASLSPLLPLLPLSLSPPPENYSATSRLLCLRVRMVN